MSSRYQLTIVGTRFPHLALGVLLAKKGRKVLIVDTLTGKPDQDNGPSSGYRFRKRPVPLFGLDGHGFLRRFLDELGIGRMLVNKTYPPNPVSYQVILPRHRINVHPEREKLFAELAREFPGRIDPLRQLYGEWDGIASQWHTGLDNLQALEKGWLHLRGLPRYLGNFSRIQKFKGLLQGVGPGPETDFFALQNFFLGAHFPGAFPPPLSSALVQSIGRRGTSRETTGTFGLRSLLIQRFQEYGGQVISGVGVTGIETTSRNELDLFLGDGSSATTRTLATTEGIAAGIPEIPPRKHPRIPRDHSPLYPLRFYIGLDKRFIPEGMEDDLFLMREDEGGPLGLRFLYLALSPVGSEAAPEGKRALTVTALTSKQVFQSLSPEMIKTVTDDLLQSLESVIPFLPEGLDHVSSDLKPGNEHQTPRPVGSGITAWSPGIMSRLRIRTALGGRIAVLSPTPLELGIEGEALTAITAAGILGKIIGKEI